MRIIGHLPTALLVYAVFQMPQAAHAQAMDYGLLERIFKGPVTTSATGSPQRVTDVPVNMFIITADDIRRSGARDITGVLRHVFAVDSLQWGTDSTDVSIRAYNQSYAARTLVLIDGRQVYADYYGFVPWSTLPVELSAIRQIEVVRGPNTALFGFNAAGGVINIITYNPKYDDIDSLTLRAGSQGLADVSAVATFGLGKQSALRVSGSYRTDSDFDTRLPLLQEGGVPEGNARSAFNAVANFGFDRLELGIEASHSQAKVNEMSPNYVMQLSRYDTNSIEGRAEADTSIGLIHFKSYSNWIDWNGAPLVDFPEFSLHNNTVVADIDDVIALGTAHTLRLAFSYHRNVVNTAPVGGGEIHSNLYSSAAMWNWNITSDLSFTSALRFDHLSLGRSGDIMPGVPRTNSFWSRTLEEWSFNTGLVWNAAETDTFRVIVSRGIQLPNLVQLGALQISVPGYIVSGTPTLDPTSVYNYEFIWNHAIPSWDASIQSTTFYQNIQCASSFSGAWYNTPTGIVRTPSNIGSSESMGVALTAGGNIYESWHWSLNLRWVVIADHFIPSVAGGVDFVDYENTNPKNSMKANIGWASGAWEIDTYWYLQSRGGGLVQNNNASYPVGIAAYGSADARIGYRLTDWATLSVSGTNLLQAKQRQTTGPLVERQWFVSLTLKH